MAFYDAKYDLGGNIDDRYESVIFKEYKRLFLIIESQAFIKGKVVRPCARILKLVDDFAFLYINYDEIYSAVTSYQELFSIDLNSRFDSFILQIAFYLILWFSLTVF